MQNLKAGLVAIEDDQRVYTLDKEDMEAQNVILKKRDRSKKDADILQRSLSCRYPNLEFHEALKEEKQKLHAELQRSKTNKDQEQCRVIQHLLPLCTWD